MAEPKRHMDVPQGACFGRPLTNWLPPSSR